MASIRWFVLSAGVTFLLTACGGAECATDNDCKGSRVCTQGACVDPSGGGGFGGNTGGNTGGSGGNTGGSGGNTGGSGGSGALPACYGGKDSDCPSGAWCNNKQCVATTKGKVGDTCTANSDCAGSACLVRNQGDIAGYCSKRCESFSHCPSFWDCKDLGNAAGTYCVQ